jgi:hypothetical protein
MRMTHKLDILHAPVTIFPIRLVMVELEPVAFGAAAAVLSNEGALTIVTLVNGAPDRSRDVPRRR